MILKTRLTYCLATLFVLVTLSSYAIDDSTVDELQQAEPEIASVQERRIIVQLREQKLKNKQQAEELRKEKNELNLLRIEVDKKLDELRALRIEVAALLEVKNAKEQEKVLELSKMYNKMDPAKAASIISELDRELAIGILGGMKAKSAGKVLANLTGEKAAILSSAYATLKED